MLAMAFISRHAPSHDQTRLAEQQGWVLIPVGDRDAFSIDPKEFTEKFQACVVVHPMAAMRMLPYMPVGVFSNVNRAKEGEPPQFFTNELVVMESMPPVLYGDSHIASVKRRYHADYSAWDYKNWSPKWVPEGERECSCTGPSNPTSTQLFLSCNCGFSIWQRVR